MAASPDRAAARSTARFDRLAAPAKNTNQHDGRRGQDEKPPDGRRVPLEDRHYPRFDAVVRSGIILGKRGVDAIGLGGRLGQRDARRKARKARVAPGTAVAVSLIGRNGKPDGGNGTRKPDGARRDADDRVEVAADTERAVDDIGIAPETLEPEVVAEKHLESAEGGYPPEDKRRAEDAEEVGGRETRRDKAGTIVEADGDEIVAAGEREILERGRTLPPGAHIERGHAPRGRNRPGGRGGGEVLDDDELAAAIVEPRAQVRTVEEREGRRSHRGNESGGQNRRGGVRRGAEKRANDGTPDGHEHKHRNDAEQPAKEGESRTERR